jgi:hypothetical protein
MDLPIHALRSRFTVAFGSMILVVGCGSTRVTSATRTGDPTLDASVQRRDAAPVSLADSNTGRAATPDAALATTSIMDAARASTTSNAGRDAAVDAGDPRRVDACGHPRPDVFADAVVSFMPGPTAGFGAKNMPCVVLGPPDGAGPSGGSLDVVSLGDQGTIVLEFEDVELIDEPGPDLLVFENAFPGWAEPGFVAVSDDGETWSEWPCEPQNVTGGYPYCAGVNAVLSNPMNGIDPTDPTRAGGDAFDLADVNVGSAHFVRIRDSGFSQYSGVSGGFDLDAIAAVHSRPASGAR